MIGFEKVELDDGVDQEQRRAEHPPEGNVPRQGLCNSCPPKLDADQQLGDNDGDHHPALPAQFVTFRVVQKFECLAQGNLAVKCEFFQKEKQMLTAPQSRMNRRRIGFRR